MGGTERRNPRNAAAPARIESRAPFFVRNDGKIVRVQLRLVRIRACSRSAVAPFSERPRVSGLALMMRVGPAEARSARMLPGHDHEWNRRAVEQLLHRASEEERRSASASPGSHDEQVVISPGLTVEGWSGVAAKQPVGLVRAAADQLLESPGVVRGDGASETARGKTEQITALFDHGRANVRDRPDVGEGNLTVRPSDEFPGGPNGGPGFRRKIDADENTKRRGHLGDSNGSADAVSPRGAAGPRTARLGA
jgi:hypothetical protein